MKKNPWKRFIVVVSALVIVIMVCVTTNMVINSIVSSIAPQGNAGLQVNVNTDAMQGNNGGSFVTDNGGYNQQGGVAVDPNQQGGVAVDPNQQGGAAPNQGGATPNQQGGSNPLSYTPAQLVDFYNAALKKSYTYKLNASKTEQVDVSVSGIEIGALGLNPDQMANDIIKNNTKNNGVVQTKSFVNGKATDDGSSIQQFVLPTNLYADAVKSINISQTNQGYKMVIALKSESCAHNGKAAYNASCTWPLDVNVIDFGSAVTIKECTFNYPGTVITAMIDSQGRVYAVQTEMPLNVSNAKATAVGVNITVGSISGKWTCVNELKFL